MYFMSPSQTRQLINLNSLLDFSARLNETNDERFIINSALLSLMGKLKILRACVMLPSAKGNYDIILCKGKVSYRHSDEETSDFRFEDHTYTKAIELLKGEGFIYFLPLRYKGEILATICMGPKIENESLLDEEQRYSDLVCTIAANAIMHARSNKSLIIEKNIVEQRNLLLDTLFEIRRDFTTLLSREEILKALSYHLMGQLMISRFMLYLRDDDGKNELIINRFNTHLPDKVIDRLFSVEDSFSMNSSTLEEDIVEMLDKAKAAAVAPLTVQGEAKGLLITGKRMNDQEFSGENIQFLEALGNTALSALENERLFKEEVEKKRLENELNLALDIQKNLLPKSVPQIEGFGIAGTSRPSRHVGGDYYDFIQLPGGRLMIAIADVSGKGMPASLLMANVQASLRLLAPLDIPLVDMILRINTLLYQNTSADKFVTFFCGILDTNNSKFNYINAGHNPPLHIRADGSFSRLSEGGLILGFMDTPFDYSQGEIFIAPKESVTLYTDGVTETLDKDQNEYGEEKLINLLKDSRQNGAPAILDSIVDDVLLYSDGQAQYDDITCVVLKRD